MYAENLEATAARTARTRTEARGFAAAPADARTTMLAVTAALTVMAFAFGAVLQTGGFFVAGTALLIVTLLSAAAMLDRAETAAAAEPHAMPAARSLGDVQAIMRRAVFSTVHPSLQSSSVGR